MNRFLTSIIFVVIMLTSCEPSYAPGTVSNPYNTWGEITVENGRQQDSFYPSESKTQICELRAYEKFTDGNFNSADITFGLAAIAYLNGNDITPTTYIKANVYQWSSNQGYTLYTSTTLLVGTTTSYKIHTVRCDAGDKLKLYGTVPCRVEVAPVANQQISYPIAIYAYQAGAY